MMSVVKKHMVQPVAFTYSVPVSVIQRFSTCKMRLMIDSYLPGKDVMQELCIIKATQSSTIWELGMGLDLNFDGCYKSEPISE